MFRYERPQKGRKRQFFQAGVELIGNAIYGDLEVIQVANMSLDKLGIESNLEINFQTLEVKSHLWNLSKNTILIQWLILL